MVALKTLQSQFQAYLIDSNANPIMPSIAPDARFSAPERLKVYHDAYRLRLLEILKLDFSKTHVLLGDDNFDEAFFQYLQQYPSHHFSVRYFGQHFAHFLRTQAPYKDHTMLAEMAEFEWALNFTIDAADAPIAKTTMLAGVDPEQWPDLRFIVHPSMTSLYLHWDTPALWHDIDNEQPPRAPIQQAQPMRWLFWRKGIKTYFQSCTPAEDQLFKALLANHNFGEMCESLIDILPEEEIPQVAAHTLFKWIQEEMISDIL